MSTIGWDDQEELDYSKVIQDTSLPILPVVRKPSLPTEDQWQRRPSKMQLLQINDNERQ